MAGKYTQSSLYLAVLLAAQRYLVPLVKIGGFVHGGYTDSLIDYNTAVVTFRGNHNTPP